MKKKVFALTMIIGFIWGSLAFAWQDPCNAVQYNYTYEGYTLTGWADTTSSFSPAPKCSGTVLLLDSDTWILLDYISYEDTILIANIPCRVTDKGNLVCKVITQPEKSYTLHLKKE
jgi:hypothetical protein